MVREDVVLNRGSPAGISGEVVDQNTEATKGGWLVVKTLGTEAPTLRDTVVLILYIYSTCFLYYGNAYISFFLGGGANYL